LAILLNDQPACRHRAFPQVKRLEAVSAPFKFDRRDQLIGLTASLAEGLI
jgi:hypothetical protein